MISKQLFYAFEFHVSLFCMKTFPRERLGLFNVNKTLEIFANVAKK